MLNFCAKLRDVGRASTDVVSMSFVCSVAQSCSTLCDPMDYSLASCSVHRTLQAKILEWIAISSSRGSSRSRDQIRVSSTAGKLFTF